ncbi:recombinase family protein [Nocardia sp. NPDC058519]|uniref:recombinase family protein n=1 Tax=Nocardia sp. NPDC058519 TaxID=3346535 RepID=UPI003651C5BE
MRAAVYLRQSLDRSGNMLAISRQRDDCLKLCAERGWEPVEYVDNDISATRSKKRPDYDRMLKHVASGEIRAIVSWDLDRLYRRPIELEHLIDIADKNGLLLATITGDADLSTDNGRLFARIKGAVAKAETERAGARRRAMAKQRAEAGENWSPRRSFGYTQEMEPHPEEARLVVSAYAAIIAGHSCRSIATAWNRAGVTTTLGNQWTGPNVSKMLQRPRYAALRTYQGKVIGPANWPELVPRDVWEAAQTVFRDPSRLSNKGPRVRKHLLTSVAGCGKCNTEGAAIAGKSPKKLPIYTCRECHGVVRSQSEVDEFVVDTVVGRLSREDARELLVDDERPDIAELRSEAAVLRARIKALAAMYGRGEIDDEQLTLGTKTAKGLLQAVESKMSNALRAKMFEGVIGADDVRAAFDELDLGRRRAIVQALMRITILPTVKGREFHSEHIQIEWL